MPDIPKHLRHLLLKRGGMARITQELQRRASIVEKPNLVYSTQQGESRRVDENKNKGCAPCSNQIRPVEQTHTVGRTEYYGLAGKKPFSFQTPYVHVQGERKSR